MEGDRWRWEEIDHCTKERKYVQTRRRKSVSNEGRRWSPSAPVQGEKETGEQGGRAVVGHVHAIKEKQWIASREERRMAEGPEHEGES